MIRTSLDDTQWVSLMLVMQQIPLVWKRDDVALRRFIEAALRRQERASWSASPTAAVRAIMPPRRAREKSDFVKLGSVTGLSG